MRWNTKKRVEMRSRGGNEEMEHKKRVEMKSSGGNDELEHKNEGGNEE